MFMSKESIKRRLASLVSRLHNLNPDLQDIRDLLIEHHGDNRRLTHQNPLNRFGKQCFSQSDEDGITLEIISRMSIQNGTFAELGVGDGLENNTLILASLGWHGFWVGNDDLAFGDISSTKFKYLKGWITSSNVADFFDTGLTHLDKKELDVVSIDLDGNDIYIVDNILSSNHKPKLFIVEYNAKFPPPIRFQVKYDIDFTWTHDDYFGASLSSFVDQFSQHGYRLVCCNAQSGSNAFFVRNDFAHLFSDVPDNVDDIYVEPRYMIRSKFGHPKSARLVREILTD